MGLGGRAGREAAGGPGRGAHKRPDSSHAGTRVPSAASLGLDCIALGEALLGSRRSRRTPK